MSSLRKKNQANCCFQANILTSVAQRPFIWLFQASQQNTLTRLGKGIYWKPKKDPQFGPMYPSLEEIARKIAEKERVVIRPDRILCTQ